MEAVSLDVENQKRLRGHLNAVRMISIVAIVFCHAPDFVVNTFLYQFISVKLTASRLPLIFVLSGFFLLRKDLLSIGVYAFEVKKRIKSLVVPYFFWSLLVLLLVIVAQNLNLLAGRIGNSGYSVGDGSVFDCLCALFGIGRVPLHYQFGFLRSLFLLVLLSPFLRLLLEKQSIGGLLIAEVAAVFLPGVGYFYLGGLIWKYELQQVFLPRKYAFAVCVTMLVAAFAMRFSLPAFVLTLNSLVFLLSAASLLYSIAPSIVSRISEFSFVVFATHEPTISVVGKVLQHFSTKVNNSLLYLFSAFLTVGICLVFGVIFKRLMPRIYSVSVGDR